MEYCNGGSLYSILDQPTNAYGLEEEEFILFLRHICEYCYIGNDCRIGCSWQLIVYKYMYVN